MPSKNDRRKGKNPQNRKENTTSSLSISQQSNLPSTQNRSKERYETWEIVHGSREEIKGKIAKAIAEILGNYSRDFPRERAKLISEALEEKAKDISELSEKSQPMALQIAIENTIDWAGVPRNIKENIKRQLTEVISHKISII